MSSDEAEVKGKRDAPRRIPSEEEFVEMVLSECAEDEPGIIESVERDMNLPEGAIVNGSREHGLLPAAELVARARARVERR